MKTFLLPLILLPLWLPAPPSQAASQDECAIWLCLPTGFLTGCSGAKKAFRKRILKGKSPLPSFSSCAVTPDPLENALLDTHGSEITAIHGVAAVIPPSRKCLRWERRWEDQSQQCTAWETVPEQRIKGTRCYRYGENREAWTVPSGCTRTLNYTDTFMDGVQYGETYYW